MGESTDQESRYILDLVGEETSLDECALCHAVSCFSCVKGYCTALEKVTVGGCVFYKDAAQNWKEIRRCFYRLISRERFDLLRKYADTIAALGLMDAELADAELQRKRLGDYQSLQPPTREPIMFGIWQRETKATLTQKQSLFL